MDEDVRFECFVDCTDCTMHGLRHDTTTITDKIENGF